MPPDAAAALAVRHLPDARRFAVDIDGATAYISYRERGGGIFDLDHTFVPSALRGRGIASQLTAHALSFARAEGRRVAASCPFVAAYLRRHPEYRELLA
jgi:predicted GNAT family acetyltransferase